MLQATLSPTTEGTEITEQRPRKPKAKGAMEVEGEGGPRETTSGQGFGARGESFMEQVKILRWFRAANTRPNPKGFKNPEKKTPEAPCGVGSRGVENGQK